MPRTSAKTSLALSCLLLVTTGCRLANKFAPLPYEPDTLTYFCDSDKAPVRDVRNHETTSDFEARQIAYGKQITRDVPPANTPPTDPPADTHAKARAARLAAVREARTDPQVRKRVVSQIEREIMDSQTSYIANASRHRAVLQITTDLAVLGLNTSGTVIGVAATKAALAAAAAGVGSAKLAFTTDFDGGLSRAQLLAAMLRNNQQNAAIIDGKRAKADYPLEEACTDLHNLYLGGTEDAALTTVSKDTSTNTPAPNPQSGTPATPNPTQITTPAASVDPATPQSAPKTTTPDVEKPAATGSEPNM